MFGINVYPMDMGSTLEQYRYPRSKKKRIRKKWRKTLGNYRRVPVRASYMVGDRLVCDHATYAELRAGLTVDRPPLPGVR